MKLFIGADHRGYNLKETLKSWLSNQGIEWVDCGADSYIPNDDAIDYAQVVASQIKIPSDRGILLCGSGQAMMIAANRFPHVNAIMGFNEAVVEQGRNHDNANVLCLPAEHVSDELAQRFVDIFLHTNFNELERYQRRQKKLEKLST